MNLEEEVRNDYTISAEMKKVWSVQMELLKKLLDVCERHDLKVWVDSGTLIGAIRDGGFIPWDDDIDTIMMRDDYEKLLSIAKSEFTHPYFLLSKDSALCPMGHAQLKMDGTCSLSQTDIENKVHYHCGIFIDIFVYDGVPEDETEINRSILRTEIWRKAVNCICIRQNGIKGLIRDMIRVALLAVTNYNYVYSRFESCFRKYRVADYDRIYYWGLSTKRLKQRFIKKDWYRETIYVQFEDMKVPVPIEYDKRLRAEYGDYTKPVKAPTAHETLLLSADKSYEEALKELKTKRKK